MFTDHCKTGLLLAVIEPLPSVAARPAQFAKY
jgi:hypothetical protein